MNTLSSQIMKMQSVECEGQVVLLAAALNAEVAGMRAHDAGREYGQYCDDTYFEIAAALKHLAELAYGRLPE